MKKRGVKLSSHKILEEQSQKLRDKLELLKQQIQMKKKQKQISKNSSLGNSNVVKSRTTLNQEKYKTADKDKSKELTLVLAQLKMESIQNKLRDKQITTLSKLFQLSAEEIDKWRDISVGYRIKLKKYIQQCRNGKVGQSSNSQKKQSQDRDIEAIIKNRKEERVYETLNRPTEEDEEQDQGYIDEQNQQVMIQSLMEVFQTQFKLNDASNNSSFAKKTMINQNQDYRPLVFRSVASENPNMNCSNIFKICSQQDKFPKYKYCWSCLAMIKDCSKIQFQNRQFCGQKCKQTYKQTLKIQQDSNFFEQIQQTQQKFSQLLHNRLNNNNPNSARIQEDEISFQMM